MRIAVVSSVGGDASTGAIGPAEVNLKVCAQILVLGQQDFARLIDTTEEKFCVVGKLFAGANIRIDAQLT